MALIMLMGFIAFIALPSVVWLYALADVIRNEFRFISTKIAWLTVLCFFVYRNMYENISVNLIAL